MFVCEIDFNNNFFNSNMNPYFTPTSFDSDNSNPAFNNMNQSKRPDWMYSTQYNSYLQSYDQIFQNNLNSSHSRSEFASPEPNFQPPFHNIFFSNFASYTSFLESPTKEKSELEKSIEAMQEAER